MIVCSVLLFPLYTILQILIPIIQQIVTTVCSWVSTVIQVIKEVVSRICRRLPWPFNLLCRFIVTLITVLETVWNYVCNVIVQTIIDIIVRIIVVLIYVTRIICIVVNIIVGLPAFLICLLGLSPQKYLRICIKVITDKDGKSQVKDEAIELAIRRMNEAYKQCNIKVIRVGGVEHIPMPNVLNTTNCSFAGLFSGWHAWFTQTACNCCNIVTVFFVDDIQGAAGCAYWGDNWCRVDTGANYDDSVMAHEVGHILNLPHVNDPNNIMFSSSSATSHNFNTSQCCFIRNQSPFVTYF